MSLPRCGVKDKVGTGSKARRRRRYALQGKCKILSVYLNFFGSHILEEMGYTFFFNLDLYQRVILQLKLFLARGFYMEIILIIFNYLINDNKLRWFESSSSNYRCMLSWVWVTICYTIRTAAIANSNYMAVAMPQKRLSHCAQRWCHISFSSGRTQTKQPAINQPCPGRRSCGASGPLLLWLCVSCAARYAMHMMQGKKKSLWPTNKKTPLASRPPNNCARRE